MQVCANARGDVDIRKMSRVLDFGDRYSLLWWRLLPLTLESEVLMSAQLLTFEWDI